MATALTRPQLGLACGITASAGFLDGVGFIHLGGYFVTFMSGNSTRAGADLAEGDLLGWGKAIGLVIAFVFGVILASLVRTRGGVSVSRAGRATPSCRLSGFRWVFCCSLRSAGPSQPPRWPLPR